MSDPKKENKVDSELTENQLEAVQGGNSISILTKMPDYNGPKKQAPASIAQGDTLDNTLTENGLS